MPENGKDGVRDRNPKPALQVPSPSQAAEQTRLAAEVGAAEKRHQEIEQSLSARQAGWEKELAVETVVEPNGPVVRFPFDGDGNGTGDDGRKWEGAPKGESEFGEGILDRSYRVQKKGWTEYGGIFDFEKDQPFTVSALMRLDSKGGSPFGKMESEGDLKGWDVEFNGTKPSFHLSSKLAANAIHVQCERDLPGNRFLLLTVTYDGSGKAAGVTIYVDGVPEKSRIVSDTLTGSTKTAEPFSVGRRGSAGPLFQGWLDELRVYSRALGAEEVAALAAGMLTTVAATPDDKRNNEQKGHLQRLYRETKAPDFTDARKQLDELKKKRDELERAIPNTMVMVEMEKPRDTFIKVRGQYDKDGEQVSAAAPAFLPQIPAHEDGSPLNRLDFAQWLVSRDQPLTARVTVNRWWAMLFGTGLVKTTNDFGSQGEWPSHPELLEWLAGDFLADWDTKRVLKQIVMSATYRQSSRVSPELLERDSENRLLARGPRQRLDAEMIRDNALAIAGILNGKIGGKSIKPQQPPGTWEINEMGGYNYDKSTGDDLYRRGLYVYWRRSTVYPSFITLDAPTREFCTAQRARTSTPLQSLVLMNDSVFVEAAGAFAQRILREGGADNAARLRFAWRTTLGRPPTVEEAGILARTLDLQLAHYAQEKDAAAALVKVGDLARPDGLDDVELAAWTAVANVLLNLNETITN